MTVREFAEKNKFKTFLNNSGQKVKIIGFDSEDEDKKFDAQGAGYIVEHEMSYKTILFLDNGRVGVTCSRESLHDLLNSNHEPVLVGD